MSISQQAERIAIGGRLAEPAELDQHRAAADLALQLLQIVAWEQLTGPHRDALLAGALAGMRSVRSFFETALLEHDSWLRDLTGAAPEPREAGAGEGGELRCPHCGAHILTPSGYEVQAGRGLCPVCRRAFAVTPATATQVNAAAGQAGVPKATP